MFRCFWTTACLVAVFALGATTAADADTTLDAGTGSGLPGDSVTISIQIDTDTTLRGFSMGLAHDDTNITLTEINVGADLTDFNDGDGPDFIQSEVDPLGGPGGFVAVVVDFQLTETIAAVDDQDVLEYVYEINAGAEVGSTTDLTFSDDLGDPAVATLVVPDLTSEVPTMDAGEVTVDVPAVQDLALEITDICVGEVTATWTNPTETYDSIRVLEDGVEIASLDGDATSHVFNVAERGESDISVIPVAVSTTEGPAAVETIDVPALETPESPADLSCSVSPGDPCIVTVTWTNPQEMGEIEVTVDAEVVATLTENETMVEIEIDDEESHAVGLSGTDTCDQAFAVVTCEVDCGNPVVFLRGDADGNGQVFPILDALFILEYGFTNGPEPECLDSADCDGNDIVFPIIDALFLLEWGFTNGEEPPDPGPDFCGPDPAETDSAGCDTPQDDCP